MSTGEIVKQSKRSWQTKRKISDAYRRLIEEEPTAIISIDAILMEAQVSRRTLYNHFKGKEDIMDHCLNVLVWDYLDQRQNFLRATSPRDVFHVTLSYFYEHRHFIRALLINHHYDLFFFKLMDNTDVIFSRLDLPWNSSHHPESIRENYMAKGLTGIYLAIFAEWLIKENPEPPQEIATYISELFQNIPAYFRKYSSQASGNTFIARESLPEEERPKLY